MPNKNFAYDFLEENWILVEEAGTTVSKMRPFYMFNWNIMEGERLYLFGKGKVHGNCP